jgi:hypothetical protein
MIAYFTIGLSLAILSIPVGIVLTRTGVLKEPIDGFNTLLFAGSLYLIWPLILGLLACQEAMILIERLGNRRPPRGA